MSDLENQELFNFIVKGLDDDQYVSKEGRIARKIMVELVKAGRAEFLLLRDDEVSEWWNRIYAGANQKLEKHKERVRLYNVKIEAYNKLTAAERKTLGIRKPVKPREM